MHGRIFPKVLLALVVVGAVRGIARHHWEQGERRGPGGPGARFGRHWEKGVPPMVEEWHRRMHETPQTPQTV